MTYSGLLTEAEQAWIEVFKRIKRSADKNGLFSYETLRSVFLIGFEMGRGKVKRQGQGVEP